MASCSILFPRREVSLATRVQGASPEIDDIVAECRGGACVGPDLHHARACRLAARSRSRARSMPSRNSLSFFRDRCSQAREAACERIVCGAGEDLSRMSGIICTVHRHRFFTGWWAVDLMDSASHCPYPTATAVATEAGKRKIPSWALISNGFATWSDCKLYRVWTASRSGVVCCYTVTGVETMSVDGTRHRTSYPTLARTSAIERWRGGLERPHWGHSQPQAGKSTSELPSWTAALRFSARAARCSRLDRRKQTRQPVRPSRACWAASDNDVAG